MYQHQTVLLAPTVDALQVHDHGVYVDATFGRGGHTRYLLNQGQQLKVFAFDRDQEAIMAGQELLEDVQRQGQNQLELISANFEDLQEELVQRQITAIDGIVYDLGVSSPQFDDPARGFSYRYEARLDMRMDQTQSLDAYQIVNTWSYGELVRIFFRYGDEKFSKVIARLIIKQRGQAPIVTTSQLVDLIKEAIPAPARRHGGNPAKKVFQALRIAVNDELGALEQSLEQAINLLKPAGIISVISFQSLEDRLVKQIFRQHAQVNVPRDLPIIPPDLQPELKLITKKPILPDATELAENHRAHSAHLRVAQKLH
ncbi:16S rRNA (cytosine(1402)-N(4))-methyltransferase RsmH [Lactobacillus sp. DCY120]|uniref:Ribosomal RNA small subunit methyltransferase H n=1 Tax=Bombilactobacillus apium TaxID=2675299 RepID=A0A850R0X2_9LACO|nr:16S rRNA (cytosine(1402)-N(4))-methyltransferase RsmH [Bombilactobacillus apium]NVY95671.1 16S rRNA (cytosine(1402)-N(4))-methyltransferase RsmH [Bombilactobacillus apium]